MEYSHGFVLLFVSRDKSIFYRSDAGDKYISCCEVLQYKGDESPLRIRVHLRLNSVSIVVGWDNETSAPLGNTLANSTFLLKAVNILCHDGRC